MMVHVCVEIVFISAKMKKHEGEDLYAPMCTRLPVEICTGCSLYGRYPKRWVHCNLHRKFFSGKEVLNRRSSRT